ncbi:MAG: precorrin-6y C5,15-methyltransferase (decarboxylating) subunit CbiE [Chloroflexi bacterium]|nr:precorrin-6y C5,15-methyltransferase (decarboxylating) subunit CbiE [Chloroflexota bacterium]
MNLPVVCVVGTHGGQVFGAAAAAALRNAEVLVGAPRHLDFVEASATQHRRALTGPLTEIVEAIAVDRADGRRVSVLASGDPGFFGIVRVLAERLGRANLEIHPAPSAISLAFARAGVSWDDAEVISAHGRPLDAALLAMLDRPKVAVLTSPDQPPELVGRRLLDAGCAAREVIVATRLGEPREMLTCTDLHGLADGSFDPMSVVILLDPHVPNRHSQPSLGWGLPEAAYAHRAGMITKAEVRAVAIARLDLPAAGVLWDVGAGSGSVAIECARLAPELQVFAIERAAQDAARIASNARQHGVTVHVVESEAPAAFAGLPRPSRVFVGGGGLDVLERAIELLLPGGRIVATHVLVERAAAAWRLLGNTSQVSVARATAIADGFRLQSENPVFVSWGPGAE